MGGLARPEGLEPPAYWFEASRSIQLSYGRAFTSILAVAAQPTQKRTSITRSTMYRRPKMPHLGPPQFYPCYAADSGC
jgi:hypothetical protein